MVQHTLIQRNPALLSLGDLLKNRSSRVVTWIGAGLSQPADLPSWPKLLKNLIAVGRASNQPDDKRKTQLLALAESEFDLWRAFSHVREALGETTFNANIRLSLQDADKRPIPINYEYLWRLGIDGMISLNLDAFARRSHSAVFSGVTREYTFSGIDAAAYCHVLNSLTANKFICNLHGDLANTKSWILTKESLENLQRNQGYETFTQTCLLTRTIVFIGISADDMAIKRHLEALRSRGCDFSPHYWITDRKDIETIRFAEDNGIQVIRYDSSNNHSELTELFQLLIDFVPQEKRPSIVAPSNFSPAPVLEDLTDDELRTRSANDIRQYLNQRAMNIINQTPISGLESYQALLEFYEQSIYQAWFIPKGGRPKFFDYTIISQISSEGAFGQVYLAEKNGRQFAIKLIHQKIRDNAEMMTAFRRGVDSLKIIASHESVADKIVQFQGAWEIPAAVAMDFVSGQNLQEAVEAKMINNWEQALEISYQLATGIRAAHRLQIKHRDIRPPNIMLRNFYNADDPVDVLILDFDLSWHKDAQGESLQLSNTSNCYLAPEQLESANKKITRNALVDSFGFGMTLYYLVHGESPKINGHLTSTWSVELAPVGVFRKCETWRSLPKRIARLIQLCTKHSQESRPDMTAIAGELANLRGIIREGIIPKDAIYIIEEIATRTPFLENRYDLNTDNIFLEMQAGSGIFIKLGVDSESEQILLRLGWENRGQGEYSNIKKYIEPKSQEAADLLVKKGWSIASRKLESSFVFIDATASLNQARSFDGISSMAETLEKAIGLLAKVASV